MSFPVDQSRCETVDALAGLRRVLEEGIPMYAALGMTVTRKPGGELAATMPLIPNRNHQNTAFAGSLNTLCTIAGWGTTYLELGDLADRASVVIRRSAIRYRVPVEQPSIEAVCLLPSASHRGYFLEMLTEKGQAKLDLEVEIARPDGGEPAVTFSGSYVAIMP